MQQKKEKRQLIGELLQRNECHLNSNYVLRYCNSLASLNAEQTKDFILSQLSRLFLKI